MDFRLVHPFVFKLFKLLFVIIIVYLNDRDPISSSENRFAI